MILVCPACETRYRVDADAVELPRGRVVRCAGCGHTWRHPPAPPAVASGRPRPPPPPAAIAPPRRGRARKLGLILGLVLAGMAAVGFLARDRIVMAWPLADRLYGAIGITVEPADSGGK